MSVLVGRPAPDFSATAVLPSGQMSEVCLSDLIKDHYGLIFFYPLDFTFVCPSELIALNKRIDEFKRRQVQVMAVSIDSQFTHYAWRNTPIQSGGIGPVSYPIIADVHHRICRAYGVEHPDAGVALRGSFLIDKAGIVQAAVVNNLPLGRNIDEQLRVVDALQFHESHGEVCPAGWNKGDKGMEASPMGVAKYLTENEAVL